MKASPTLASNLQMVSPNLSVDTRMDAFPSGLVSTKDAVKLVTASLERTVNAATMAPAAAVTEPAAK